jgi:hypothetical protein
MAVSVATLLGWLACVAVAFEAPPVALAAGGLAYWILAHAVS